MAKRHTVAVDARFCFDVEADSEEEALEIAREKLNSVDPVNDYSGLNGAYSYPWIAPYKEVGGVYPSMEVTDVVED